MQKFLIFVKEKIRFLTADKKKLFPVSVNVSIPAKHRNSRYAQMRTGT